MPAPQAPQALPDAVRLSPTAQNKQDWENDMMENAKIIRTFKKNLKDCIEKNSVNAAFFANAKNPTIKCPIKCNISNAPPWLYPVGITESNMLFLNMIYYSVIPTGYSQGGASFSTKPSSLREIQIGNIRTIWQFHNTENLCVGLFGEDT